MKLILASQSPRRKNILEKFGYEFCIMTTDVKEIKEGNPDFIAKENARLKAKSVFDGLSASEKKESIVVGADTIVVIDNKILGKPNDKEEAKKMLKTLSNRLHRVTTGYCIVSSDETICDSENSQVYFKKLDDDFIDEYVATGKPLDKAGAYGLQDGFELAKKYEGSYYNIIGLPIETISKIIDKKLGKNGR